VYRAGRAGLMGEKCTSVVFWAGKFGLSGETFITVFIQHLFLG
jgi:hypothetical protein